MLYYSKTNRGFISEAVVGENVLRHIWLYLLTLTSSLPSLSSSNHRISTSHRAESPRYHRLQPSPHLPGPSECTRPESHLPVLSPHRLPGPLASTSHPPSAGVEQQATGAFPLHSSLIDKPRHSHAHGFLLPWKYRKRYQFKATQRENSNS